MAAYEERTQQIVESIGQLFGDKSASRDEARDALITIRDECDLMLSALDEDDANLGSDLDALDDLDDDSGE